MRPESAEVARRPLASTPRHSLFGELVAAGLLAIVFAVVLVAAARPVATAAVVGTAVVAYTTGRTLARRRGGRARKLCVPRTDVCLNA